MPALAALTAPAQPAPPAPPAPTPPGVPAAGAPVAGAAAMNVVVLEVKGTVQASTDEGKSWVPAKAGLELPQGASFRTGFKSSVTCGIPPDQGFTLESLGTVKVERGAQDRQAFQDAVGHEIRGDQLQHRDGGAEHETTIRTPGSTLSVRGTVVRVTDRAGFAPTAESFTGRAIYKTARGTTAVGTKGGTYARVAANQGDAAQTALNQTVVDPTAALSRTSTESAVDRSADLPGRLCFVR